MTRSCRSWRGESPQRGRGTWPWRRVAQRFFVQEKKHNLKVGDFISDWKDIWCLFVRCSDFVRYIPGPYSQTAHACLRTLVWQGAGQQVSGLKHIIMRIDVTCSPEPPTHSSLQLRHFPSPPPPQFGQIHVESIPINLQCWCGSENPSLTRIRAKLGE